MEAYDVCVVGGGSAGFAAAIAASELGARVALVESGTIGGTCVNVGCVPSKTLLAAAEAVHRAAHTPFRGVKVHADPPDVSAVVAQKDELVLSLRQAKYVDVLAAYPSVRWIRGTARLEAPDRVRVGDDTLRAGKVIVATGARPWAPPIPGLQEAGYWTSTEALSPPRFPRRLLVLGGSAVGLELGQLYARLGSRVTVLEAMPRLLPAEDEEISAHVTRYLQEEGVQVRTGVRVSSVVRRGEETVVRFAAGGGEEEAVGDALLVATGRRPYVANLGLQELGVTLTPGGGIEVDEYLQTNVPGVYAAGDVTGQAMFVYVAAYQGTLAARNALGEDPQPQDLSAVPRVTFTDPAVASVGLTAEQARDQGLQPVESSLPLEHVPRALANRDTRGVIKLVAEEGSGRVLGAHVVAAQAGEVIQEAVVAVRFGLTLEDLRTTLHPYLTMVEGLKLAAMSFDKDVRKLSCCAG